LNDPNLITASNHNEVFHVLMEKIPYLCGGTAIEESDLTGKESGIEKKKVPLKGMKAKKWAPFIPLPRQTATGNRVPVCFFSTFYSCPQPFLTSE
jgi:hypothetical protein